MPGPSRNQFGDIIPSALSYEPVQTQEGIAGNMALQIGQILRAYAVDDPQNAGGQNGTFTFYDVLVYLPDGSTDVCYRCRSVQPLFGGGLNNFMEVLTVDSGSDENKEIPKISKRSPYVVVAYLDGEKQNGVILGAWPHDNPVAVARRPKKSEGVITKSEIQGLYFEVNNDGELTVTFQGPRDDKGALIDDKGPTTLKIDKLGAFQISTKKGQLIKIDMLEDIISINNESTSVELDAKTSTVTVDGGTIIAEDKKGGKLKIANGKVGLGTSTNELLDLIDQLLDALRSEKHICSEPGYPSDTPINSPTYASIQNKIKKIKGGV